MAKLKKHQVTITYRKPDGDVCSIVCRYFIREGCTILGIKVPELEPQNKISEVSIDHK